jgi:hypothetical protein
MHKILVPIENFSALSLSAAYFAIEFAKRNPRKILFLIFSPPAEGKNVPSAKTDESGQGQFEALVRQARAEKISLELFSSGEAYLETVCRFARDHNISEVIMAVPPVQEPLHNKLTQRIESLRNCMESQIVIVRPKEEKNMAIEVKPKEGGKPLPLKPRTFTDKGGQ